MFGWIYDTPLTVAALDSSVLCPRPDADDLGLTMQGEWGDRQSIRTLITTCAL